MLQHPDEVSNAKGTAIIAELGLQQYVSWKGEDFTRHQGLIELLADSAERVAILFPAENAIQIKQMSESHNIEYLIVIDASWRKAQKIWQINPQLHQLRALSFSDEHHSDYRIRKIPQAGYLSTIESIVLALNALEGDQVRYQSMLDLFRQMVDFQIKSMGEDTYQRHYIKKSDDQHK